MDINDCGIEGFMPHKSLYGKQVCAIFIKMCTESMPERMTGQSFRPSQSLFMFMDMAGEIKGIDRSGRIGLFWEKPLRWAVILKPVFCQEIEGCG